MKFQKYLIFNLWVCVTDSPRCIVDTYRSVSWEHPLHSHSSVLNLFHIFFILCYALQLEYNIHILHLNNWVEDKFRSYTAVACEQLQSTLFKLNIGFPWLHWTLVTREEQKTEHFTVNWNSYSWWWVLLDLFWENFSC